MSVYAVHPARCLVPCHHFCSAVNVYCDKFCASRVSWIWHEPGVQLYRVRRCTCTCMHQKSRSWLCAPVHSFTKVVECATSPATMVHTVSYATSMHHKTMMPGCCRQVGGCQQDACRVAAAAAAGSAAEPDSGQDSG